MLQAARAGCRQVQGRQVVGRGSNPRSGGGVGSSDQLVESQRVGGQIVHLAGQAAGTEPGHLTLTLLALEPLDSHQ